MTVFTIGLFPIACKTAEIKGCRTGNWALGLFPVYFPSIYGSRSESPAIHGCRGTFLSITQQYRFLYPEHGQSNTSLTFIPILYSKDTFFYKCIESSSVTHNTIYYPFYFIYCWLHLCFNISLF